MEHSIIQHGIDNSHQVHAMTTSLTTSLTTTGCGGVPDGFHGGIGAGSVDNGGFSANVNASYGSPGFSVIGNAGTTQTHSGNFYGSTDTGSATLYVCPPDGNTYSVGFNGTQSNSSSFGFSGLQTNGGAFSFGSTW